MSAQSASAVRGSATGPLMNGRGHQSSVAPSYGAASEAGSTSGVGLDAGSSLPQDTRMASGCRSGNDLQQGSISGSGGGGTATPLEVVNDLRAATDGGEAPDTGLPPGAGNNSSELPEGPLESARRAVGQIWQAVQVAAGHPAMASRPPMNDGGEPGEVETYLSAGWDGSRDDSRSPSPPRGPPPAPAEVTLQQPLFPPEVLSQIETMNREAPLLSGFGSPGREAGRPESSDSAGVSSGAVQAEVHRQLEVMRREHSALVQGRARENEFLRDRLANAVAVAERESWRTSTVGKVWGWLGENFKGLGSGPRQTLNQPGAGFPPVAAQGTRPLHVPGVPGSLGAAFPSIAAQGMQPLEHVPGVPGPASFQAVPGPSGFAFPPIAAQGLMPLEHVQHFPRSQLRV